MKVMKDGFFKREIFFKRDMLSGAPIANLPAQRPVPLSTGYPDSSTARHSLDGGSVVGGPTQKCDVFGTKYRTLSSGVSSLR